MKQTKSMRFRELLPIILELENSKLHLQDGIVEILKDKYGLEISLNTYRNYLFRYAPKDDNFPPASTAIPKNESKQNTIIEPLNTALKNDDSSSEVEDDDAINPDVLSKLMAELETDKTTITSKSLFNNKD